MFTGPPHNDITATGPLATPGHEQQHWVAALCQACFVRWLVLTALSTQAHYHNTSSYSEIKTDKAAITNKHEITSKYTETAETCLIVG